jgi:hypothetical protein
MRNKTLMANQATNDDYADYEQQSLYRVVKTTLSTWLVVGVVLASVILVALVALLVAYKSGRRHHYGNGTGGDRLRWVRDCTSRLVGSASLSGPNNCGGGGSGSGRHCDDDDDHESPPSGRLPAALRARILITEFTRRQKHYFSAGRRYVQASGRTAESTPCRNQQQQQGCRPKVGMALSNGTSDDDGGAKLDETENSLFIDVATSA